MSGPYRTYTLCHMHTSCGNSLLCPGTLCGILAHSRALYIHAILFGPRKYGTCQLGLKLFRTISEICLGRTHMCGIGHRILTPLG